MTLIADVLSRNKRTCTELTVNLKGSLLLNVVRGVEALYEVMVTVIKQTKVKNFGNQVSVSSAWSIHNRVKASYFDRE